MSVTCQSHVQVICHSIMRQSYVSHMCQAGSHISITCPASDVQAVIFRLPCGQYALFFFGGGVGCVRVSQDCLLRHRHRHVIHKVHKNFQTCDVERHLQMIMVTKLNVWTDTAVDISCEVHVISFRGGRLTSLTIHFRTRRVYLFSKLLVSCKVNKTAANHARIIKHTYSYIRTRHYIRLSVNKWPVRERQ